MTVKTMVLLIAVTMALTVLGLVSVGARTNDEAFSAEKTYNTKCKTCHGPKAEKKFDPTKTDEEHIQIILKGKKAEKPPNMPAYEAKGITPDQAKLLLDHMKSLRQ